MKSQVSEKLIFTLTTTFGLLVLLIVGSITSEKIEVNYDAAVAKSMSSLIQKRMPASLKSARGLSVVIDAGEVAYLDESTNIDTLIINGELHCDEQNADAIVELRVKTIHVNGLFQCGTPSNPYNKKLIISLKDSYANPKQDPSYRGIIVYDGGKMSIHGDRSKAGWTKLAETANVGDDSIVIINKYQLVKEAVEQTRSPSSYSKSYSRNSPRNIGASRPYFNRSHGYKIGDQIAIGPTGYNFEEAETFTITDINPSEPNRLYLDNPIAYKHWGEPQIFQKANGSSVTLDESAEVANLTRAILIRADEEDFIIPEGNGPTDQWGGHIMVHNGGEGYLDSVELYKMGQAGVMARYPFHWHLVGNAPGQYVKNSSIHHSFQRCITVHRTHKVSLYNNVCFNFKGHGYFLEDGNEIENKIIKNLAIMAKAPSSSKILLASDDINHSEGQGRFPSVSGFWIAHPNNYITNNVVSGSVGTGFWMSYEKQIKDFNGNVIATPLFEATDTFNYNTAHACKTGITWDGAPGWQNANNPNNPNDRKIVSAHYRPPVVPYFKGLKAYKNSLSGIYFRGDTAVYDRAFTADNGWSFWVAYNQIIRNSIFIGKTNNSSTDIDDFYYNSVRSDRQRKTAMILYDGPFEIHNSHFLNYSTEDESYTKANGQTFDSTVIPFTSTGGSNKFTNLVSGLSFYPEPKYRANLEDANVNYNARQFLANSVIRDKDGSLSGTGVESVITGTRSMGVRPQDNCVENNPQLHNFKVCPANYTEGSLAFMRWGSPYASPWGTPFVVQRSDGQTSYPINEWNSIYGRANNLFATANSTGVFYKLLPKFQYEKDRLIGATARVDANTESETPIIPMVQIVAYGNNCRLEDGAVEATSKADLLTKTVTSYYSNGEEFYVRVIPFERWGPIVDDPVVQATAFASNDRYGIKCDEGYLPKRIKGSIVSITRDSNTTTISGWACNYTKNSSVQVKVFAGGPPIRQPAQKRSTGTPPYTQLTQISQGYSNQTPSADISMKCGYMSGSGRQFNITMNNSDLASYTNHKFYVKGISNSGGADLMILNSGKYRVLPRTTKPVEVLYKDVEKNIRPSRKSFRRR